MKTKTVKPPYSHWIYVPKHDTEKHVEEFFLALKEAQFRAKLPEHARLVYWNVSFRDFNNPSKNSYIPNHPYEFPRIKVLWKNEHWKTNLFKPATYELIITLHVSETTRFVLWRKCGQNKAKVGSYNTLDEAIIVLLASL